MIRLIASVLLLLPVLVARADPVRLDQMPADATYKGEAGGLYGEGRNDPPEALANHAKSSSESSRRSMERSGSSRSG